jgi:hypothetical protein
VSKWPGRLKRFVAFIATLVGVWIVAALVHELAHGLTAQALGGHFAWLYLWPGIEVLPRPGRFYQDEWGTSIAKTAYGLGPDWQEGGWQEGLVWLMGSVSNLVLAALALGGLWRFRPSGWLRRLLVAETLMVEDIFLYVVFPEYLGLRHYVVYGGVRPEPVDGAAMLGCPRWAAATLIVIVSTLVIGGLVAYLRRHPVRG